MDTLMQTLLDRERLKVLLDLALIDAPEETVYNKITHLASKAIGAPISLMSMVGGDYQFFKSQVGLPDPVKSERQTPLSHSFCKHVVGTNEPLIVTDARNNDLVRENEAVADLNVIGYLGMPLTLQNGKTLGSFCVIDNKPRQWTDTEIQIVRELSEIVKEEIELRANTNIDASYQTKLEEMHGTITAFLDSLSVYNSKEDFLMQLRAARERYMI